LYAYDLFFVICHVLLIISNFVTYCFDLIAYCNLAPVTTNSTFNQTFVDNGGVENMFHAFRHGMRMGLVKYRL